LLLTAVAVAADLPIDNKVPHLNPTTLAALNKALRLHPGMLMDADGPALKAAILSDQVIDEGERDLLQELVQTPLRSISVTDTVCYSASGACRHTLLEVLTTGMPELWQNGGYSRLVAHAKEFPQRQSDVVFFVEQKLLPVWKESNRENAFKPIRGAIGELYSASDQLLGREILFQACQLLDQDAEHRMPDFLYKWVQPAPAN